MVAFLRYGVLMAVLLARPVFALPMASHVYELAGSFNDQLGGSPLVPIAGGRLGPADAPGFTFGPNDGVRLPSFVSSTRDYSIELLFDFDAAGSFYKIIDFQGRGPDTGLYSGREALNLYSRAAATTKQFAPGRLADLVFTRTARGIVTAYVDGVLAFGYDDGATVITDSASNRLVLFADDSATQFREASSGFLRRLRVFDTVLTAADAADLAAGVVPPSGPVSIVEPGSASAMLVGMLALTGVAGWRLRGRSPGASARWRGRPR